MGKLSDSDRRRLASLVNLTSSQHDGEALNALRAATRISANAGLTLTEALQAGASAAIDVARIQTLEADAFERGREQGVKDERNREKRQRRQEVVAAAAPPPVPAPLLRRELPALLGNVRVWGGGSASLRKWISYSGA